QRREVRGIGDVVVLALEKRVRLLDQVGVEGGFGLVVAGVRQGVHGSLDGSRDFTPRPVRPEDGPPSFPRPAYREKRPDPMARRKSSARLGRNLLVVLF